MREEHCQRKHAEREQLTEVHGQHRTYDKYLKALKNMMGEREVDRAQARHLVEYLALALQGSLLIQHAPDYVVDAFCHGRIGKMRGLTFCSGPVIATCKYIIDRTFAGRSVTKKYLAVSQPVDSCQSRLRNIKIARRTV